MTGSAGHTTGAIRSVVLVCVLLLWTESTQVRRMVGVDSAPAVPLRLRGGMPPRRAAQRRSATGSAVPQGPLSEQPQAADRVRGGGRSRGRRGRGSAKLSRDRAARTASGTGSSAPDIAGEPEPGSSSSSEAHAETVDTRLPEAGEQWRILAEDVAALEAEIRAVRALLAPPLASANGSGNTDGGPDIHGERPGMRGAAVHEKEVSDMQPHMVHAIETATRSRTLAEDERRARVRVQEGEFSWRGVLPVMGLKLSHDADSDDEAPLLPVATLLTVFAAAPSESAGKGNGHGRVGAGKARLSGDWMLRELSMGAFVSLMLLSGLPAPPPPGQPASVAPPAEGAYSGVLHRHDGHLGQTRDDGASHVALGVPGCTESGEARGAPAGVDDCGALRVCVRVEGGPWGFDECHILSEQGVSLMLDDPLQGIGLGLPGLGAGCASSAAEAGETPVHEFRTARVMMTRCCVGGTRFESWPREEEGGDADGQTRSTGHTDGLVPAGAEDEQVTGEVGACISGVHACGHSLIGLRDTHVAACSNAALVVSDRARAAVTRGCLGRCGLVALALSAAAEARLDGTHLSGLGCAAVSLDRVSPEAGATVPASRPASRAAPTGFPDVLPPAYHLYTEDVDDASGEEAGDSLASAASGLAVGGGSGGSAGGAQPGLQCCLELMHCNFSAVPLLYLPGEAPSEAELDARRVVVRRCHGVPEPSPDDLTGEAEDGAEWQDDDSGDEQEAEGEMNPFWASERQAVVSQARAVVDVLRTLNALREPWLDRVRGLGREGLPLTPPQDGGLPPEALLQQRLGIQSAPVAARYADLKAQFRPAGLSVAREMAARCSERKETTAGEQREETDGEEAEGQYRDRGDLRRERAGLRRAALEGMAATEDKETYDEEVARWEMEAAASSGAARRHLSRLALNLTTEHFHALAPPGLADQDVSHLKHVLRDVLDKPLESMGPASLFALPSSLRRQVLSELHRYRHVYNNTPAISPHLAPMLPLDDDDSADFDDHGRELLEHAGQELARAYLERCPFPAAENLVSLASVGEQTVKAPGERGEIAADPSVSCGAGGAGGEDGGGGGESGQVGADMRGSADQKMRLKKAMTASRRNLMNAVQSAPRASSPMQDG